MTAAWSLILATVSLGFCVALPSLGLWILRDLRRPVTVTPGQGQGPDLPPVPEEAPAVGRGHVMRRDYPASEAGGAEIWVCRVAGCGRREVAGVVTVEGSAH